MGSSLYRGILRLFGWKVVVTLARLISEVCNLRGSSYKQLGLYFRETRLTDR